MKEVNAEKESRSRTQSMICTPVTETKTETYTCKESHDTWNFNLYRRGGDTRGFRDRRRTIVKYQARYSLGSKR
jgi:hypothetical protein